MNSHDIKYKEISWLYFSLIFKSKQQQQQEQKQTQQ